MATWITSDWHFNHDRPFIYEPRGFTSVEQMNRGIVERHNSLVDENDTVYVLGDLMLGSDYNKSIELIKQMKGNKIIIAGNHDTLNRRTLYIQNGWPVYDALLTHVEGYHIYLSHFPTLTSSLEKESLKSCTLNFYGHTHQQDNFFHGIPFIYHCGVDSHDCFPVNL